MTNGCGNDGWDIFGCGDGEVGGSIALILAIIKLIDDSLTMFAFSKNKVSVVDQINSGSKVLKMICLLFNRVP